MKRYSYLRGLTVSGPAVLLMLMTTLAGQQVPNMAQRLVDNSEALRQYSWTMRTEVRLQDQQQSTTLEKIRYDIDGELQVTPLGGSGQLSAELQQAVDALTRLGFSYSQPDPSKAQRFIEGASIWEGGGANAGTMRIEGENFLSQGDSVDVRMKNDRAERMDVDTSQQGTPVTVRADYRGLPSGGPTCVARLMVAVPSRALEVIVETFDYAQNAAIAASDLATLPEGTELLVRTTQALSSQENQSGQSFSAVVDQEIVINGKTAVPAGSQVAGTLVEVKKSGRIRGRAKMSLLLTSLTVGSQTQAIETNTLAIEAEGSGRRDVRRLAGAAGIGALVGAIADGGSGAAKGAAIGGGIGVGATLMTKGKEVEFPSETVFSFKLMKAIELGGR